MIAAQRRVLLGGRRMFEAVARVERDGAVWCELSIAGDVLGLGEHNVAVLRVPAWRLGSVVHALASLEQELNRGRAA